MKKKKDGGIIKIIFTLSILVFTSTLGLIVYYLIDSITRANSIKF